MKKGFHYRTRYVAVMCIGLMITGCTALLPKYVKPDTRLPEQWYAAEKISVDTKTAETSTLAEWWTTLQDEHLTRLIQRAIAGNMDLRLARSRLRQARASRAVARADLFPTIDATGNATRSRTSENIGGGTTSNLYALELDASWELDLFGGVRKSVEAAEADIAASVESLRDTLVSLLSETALTYIDVRAYQQRLKTAEANLIAQEETYQLVVWRNQAGLSDALAVEQAKYNLESTRSQIPTLKTGLEQSLNTLAVLTGDQPGAWDEEMKQEAGVPETSVRIALGIPADLLRRRPDIRKAERDLAAQTARVGVATADLYPKLTLSGTIGLESLARGDLFEAASRMFSLGGVLTTPVFHGGAIRQNIEIQSALQEQALLSYEAAVLTALKEIENAVTALTQEELKREALQAAAASAKKAVELSQSKYAAGLSDFSAVLDAQRSLLTYEDELVQSRATATGNLIRLYKALGGGWESVYGDAQQTKK